MLPHFAVESWPLQRVMSFCCDTWIPKLLLNGTPRTFDLLQMAFLAVPLKLTNEVDLVKPLTGYIENIYQTPTEMSAEVKEAVHELNKLRNRACNQPLDKHQSALDIITR